CRTQRENYRTFPASLQLDAAMERPARDVGLAALSRIRFRAARAARAAARGADTERRSPSRVWRIAYRAAGHGNGNHALGTFAEAECGAASISDGGPARANHWRTLCGARRRAEAEEERRPCGGIA